MLRKRRSFTTRIARGDSYSSSSKSIKKVSSDDILNTIQEMFKRDGRVVIDFIDDEEISLTSLKTIERDVVEFKLEEIKDIVRKSLEDKIIK